MSLIPERFMPVRSAFASVLHAGADLVNVALLVATFIATRRLWDASQTFLAKAGGIPPNPMLYDCGPSGFSGCQAYAMALWPGIHLRLLWWTAAWIAFVFAIGAAIMCVAGLRWAFWRVRGIVLTA